MDRTLRRQQHDTRLLMQLRELRERSAHRTRHVASQACEAARQAVQAGQERVTGLKARRESLGRACIDAACAGQWAWLPLARAWREQVDELIERAEYALIDEDDALAAARQRWAEADQVWRRARGRAEAAKTLADRVRRERILACDREQEQELAEVAPGRRAMSLRDAVGGGR